MKTLHLLIIFFTLISFLPSVQADEIESNTISTDALGRVYTSEENPNWQMEVDLVFPTLAGGADPLLGPSLGYQLDPINVVGVKTLFAAGRSPNGITYSLQTFWRHIFSQRQTNLFVEPSFSLNFVNPTAADTPQSRGAIGVAGGVIHHIDSQFSIGGSTGFDFSSDPLNASNSGKTGDLWISPKFGFMGTMVF